MQDAPRDTINEKINYLMESTPVIFDEMSHLCNLDRYPFNVAFIFFKKSFLHKD